MVSCRRTLKEIEEEIAKLQKEAERIRFSEKAEVVAKIREAVAYYGITVADIGLAGAGKGRRRPKFSEKSRTKYRDEAGNSWLGRGRKPQWFVEAVASGRAEAD